MIGPTTGIVCNTSSIIDNPNIPKVDQTYFANIENLVVNLSNSLREAVELQENRRICINNFYTSLKQISDYLPVKEKIELLKSLEQIGIEVIEMEIFAKELFYNANRMFNPDLIPGNFLIRSDVKNFIETFEKEFREVGINL